jgi:mono/diheme cytochrome c family protein
MPRWFTRILWTLVLLSLIPLAMIATSRQSLKDKPRISIITHMDKQKRFGGQQASTLFADGRVMRPQVAGTVSRAQGPELDAFRTGMDNGEWVTRFPVDVNSKLLERGRDRYGVFCSGCHGYAGYGDGMIAVRATQLKQSKWTPPSSFHTELVRERRVGELFNTISVGIRNMPAHGSQIPLHDRWAIVAYVKALQKSQDALLEDVPEDKRTGLR